MLIATPTLQEKSALGSEWEIRSPGQGFQPLVPVIIWFSKKREMAVKTESKWLVVFLSSVSRSSSFPADRLFFQVRFPRQLPPLTRALPIPTRLPCPASLPCCTRATPSHHLRPLPPSHVGAAAAHPLMFGAGGLAMYRPSRPTAVCSLCHSRPLAPASRHQ